MTVDLDAIKRLAEAAIEDDTLEPPGPDVVLALIERATTAEAKLATRTETLRTIRRWDMLNPPSIADARWLADLIDAALLREG